MLVKTKHFGDVELDESKVIIFEEGIMGLEGLTKYALIFDEEEGKEPTIYWLQSLEDPTIALPVVSPFIIKADYNPLVQQQLLEPLGEISEDGAGLFVLLTLTIPKEVKNITANLKAPFVINSDTQKGCQIIAENEDYDIKFRIYDILQEKNAKESEGVKEGEN